MAGLFIGPSSNWFLPNICNASESGLFAYGANNKLVVLDLSAKPPVYKFIKAIGYGRDKEKITSLSFCRAPKSTLIAIGGIDSQLKVFDLSRPVDEIEEVQEINLQKNVMSLDWQGHFDSAVFAVDESGCVLYLPLSKEPKLLRHNIRHPARVVASCPFNVNLVAIGFKNGVLAVMHLAKCEVVYRLKGHEDDINSITWAPRDPQQSQFDMATTGGDQLRVWNLERERCLHFGRAPLIGHRPKEHEKRPRWSTVVWNPDPKHRNQLLFSSNNGELFLVILRPGSQKPSWELFDTRNHGGHSRCANITIASGTSACSVSMDRQIILWDVRAMKSDFVLPNIGGFAYSLDFDPQGLGKLAIGCGDLSVRIWNTSSSKSPYSCQTFWRGIKSKVTEVLWHPEIDGWLAIGTEDGKVAVLDTVNPSKNIIISSSYHRTRVYSLSWGPCKMKSGENQDLYLYSCGNESVLIHDMKNHHLDASNLDSFLQRRTPSNANGETKRCYTEVSWKTDYKALALGHSDGLIEIFSASLELLACLTAQQHLITNLKWHPLATVTQPEVSPNHCLLAASTYDKIIHIYDLSAILEPLVYQLADSEHCTESGDSPTFLDGSSCANVAMSFKQLAGHQNKVFSLAWSVHFEGHLASASADGTIQIWDVSTCSPTGNYRGHQGMCLAVGFSPTDSGVVYSGSEDGSVQQFKLEELANEAPPLKSKERKKRIEPILVEKDESSRQGSSPVALAAAKAGDSKKKKHPLQRALFPLTNQKSGQNRVDILQDIKLLSDMEVTGSYQKDALQLALFMERENVIDLLKYEGEGHKSNGNVENAFNFDVWTGDITEALNEAASKGVLTDALVSTAPLASRDLWLEMCQAYADQLSSQGLYFKSAKYLLLCHKVMECIELLKENHLYKEAVAIAKVRLPPSDPTARDLIRAWAAKAEVDRNYEAAAKCYLSLGEPSSAAKKLAMTANVNCYRVAAYISASNDFLEDTESYVFHSCRLALMGGDYKSILELVEEQKKIGLLTGVSCLGLLSSLHDLLSREVPRASRIIPPMPLHQILVDNSSTGVLLWGGYRIESQPFILKVVSQWKTFCSLENDDVEGQHNRLKKLFGSQQNPLNKKDMIFQTSVNLTLACIKGLSSQDNAAVILASVLLDHYHSDLEIGFFKEISLLVFSSSLCWVHSEEEHLFELDAHNPLPFLNIRTKFNLLLTPEEDSLAAFFFANLLDILCHEGVRLPWKLLNHEHSQSETNKTILRENGDAREDCLNRLVWTEDSPNISVLESAADFQESAGIQTTVLEPETSLVDAQDDLVLEPDTSVLDLQETSILDPLQSSFCESDVSISVPLETAILEASSVDQDASVLLQEFPDLTMETQEASNRIELQGEASSQLIHFSPGGNFQSDAANNLLELQKEATSSLMEESQLPLSAPSVPSPPLEALANNNNIIEAIASSQMESLEAITSSHLESIEANTMNQIDSSKMNVAIKSKVTTSVAIESKLVTKSLLEPTETSTDVIQANGDVSDEGKAEKIEAEAVGESKSVFEPDQDLKEASESKPDVLFATSIAVESRVVASYALESLVTTSEVGEPSLDSQDVQTVQESIGDCSVVKDQVDTVVKTSLSVESQVVTNYAVESVPTTNHHVSDVSVVSLEAKNACSSVVGSLVDLLWSLAFNLTSCPFAKRQKWAEDLKEVESKLAASQEGMEMAEQLQEERQKIQKKLEEMETLTKGLAYPLVKKSAAQFEQVTSLLVRKISCPVAKERLAQAVKEMKEMFKAF